ncbi:MAG: hypothetical protein LUG57_08015 [Oscillospiraceae bacterium]|nr:hypothetical protein [Oscillospiraceae bacterium]
MAVFTNAITGTIIYDRLSTVFLYFLVRVCSSLFGLLLALTIIGLIIKQTRPRVKEHGKKIELVLVILLAAAIVLWIILALLCARFYG